MASAFQNAAAAYRAGRLDEAEDVCLRLLETDPSHLNALSLLESIYSAQGRLAAIIPIYKKALTLAHQFFTARSTYGGLQRLRTLGFSPEAILDIGAYEGEWMRMAKAVFPQSRVLMIEAQPDKAPVLEAACKTHDGSVEYLVALLGRSNGEAVPFFQVRHPSGSTTGSTLYEEQTSFERRTITLPMHRLDDVLAKRPPMRFPFIKLDVQGAELDVLRGGPRTLNDAEAVLLEASFLDYNKGAPQFAEAVAFLNANGFIVFDILDCFRTTRDVLFQGDILFVRKDSSLRPAGTIEFR
jgi:FkbM family methyltransferase